MAELKPMEVIMRIDFVASDREQICAHAEKVQELIRCKDCEWFRKEYGWNCIEYTVCGVSPTHHPIRREEDFCSMAERRTDG